MTIGILGESPAHFACQPHSAHTIAHKNKKLARVWWSLVIKRDNPGNHRKHDQSEI